MRSDAADFELFAPRSIQEVLTRLAEEPGKHTLLAGGTELMVALNTGRLVSRSLMSMQHLSELRFIRESSSEIEIGAGTTFTDVRGYAAIVRELPLLAQSASWTGSIANQNRGTLGGNICNASPAADSPPALLAYEAKIKLMSAAGARDMPYSEFHLGYKQTALRPNELLYSITIPCSYSGHLHYIRKVGTRNAQAISKVAIAVVAATDGKRITDIRIAAASLADRPIRCYGTEAKLRGRSFAPDGVDDLVRDARAALAMEAKPIDDIRSTAKYRTAVAANLLEEFLRSL